MECLWGSIHFFFYTREGLKLQHVQTSDLFLVRLYLADEHLLSCCTKRHFDLSLLLILSRNCTTWTVQRKKTIVFRDWRMTAILLLSISVLRSSLPTELLSGIEVSVRLASSQFSEHHHHHHHHLISVFWTKRINPSVLCVWLKGKNAQMYHLSDLLVFFPGSGFWVKQIHFHLKVGQVESFKPYGSRTALW